MAITTTPSGGPQGEFSTYTPLYSQTLSSTASSITFSNIPQTYTDLVVAVSSQNSGAYVDAYVTVNGDTVTNYSSTYLTGNGSAVASGRQTSASKVFFDYNGAPPNGTSFNTVVSHFMNYSNTTNYKSWLVRANNGASSGGTDLICGMWRSTSPITSITLTPTGSLYASGSTFTLYGIKAAATQFIPTKAAGGDIVATDGTYAYHAFTSTGVFKSFAALTADVLVVAGGGAGGGSSGGGGGAGGVRAFASQSLASNSLTTCTVGAGGAGGFNQSQISGTNSQFGSLTAAGYGNGGYGASGASTGGASGTPTNFSGGTGNTSGYPNGGGGGAGGAGGNNSGQTGGAGGSGLATVTNWGSLSAALTALGLGVNGYIAGGGGGGGGKSGGPNNGGTATAGGGNGGYGYGSGNGGSGAVGIQATGGGGGGGGVASATDGPGGAGGSGVIIVRYAL